MFKRCVFRDYPSLPLMLVASVATAACAADSSSDSSSAATQAPAAAGSVAPMHSDTPVAGAPMPGMSAMRPAVAGMNATIGTAAVSTAGSMAMAGSQASAAGGAAGASARGMQPMAAGMGGTTASAGAMATAGATAGASGPTSPGAAESGEDECGLIPPMTLAGTMAGRVREAGTIEYDVTPPNAWLAQRTELLVPEEPPKNGTVFLWPGIQPVPRGENYNPIGNGVLQPVLTWGPSCAPGNPGGHETWWISPVYVNVTSRDSAYRGCHGGPVIEVEPDHRLDLRLYLDAPRWVQKVVDLDTMKSTEYAHDMKGQAQARAFFVIELPGSAKPTEDVIFKKSVLTMAEPEPTACEPIARGMRDFASKARVSADGKHCCIDHIVLRAEGVPMTTMTP